MKVLSKLTIAILAITMMFACKAKVEGEKAKVGDAEKNVPTATATDQEYNITKGTVHWTGSKVGGTHTGTINIAKGDINVKGGNITSGSFGIDVTSLTNTDLEGESKGKLEGHLKSDDFFDVANHPMGIFSITAVTPLSGNPDATHTIKGNLELKGKTKSIEFPASVAIIGNKLSAVTPKFVINRTDWGIVYGSGNFFKELTQDNIISDEVSLAIDLEAEVQ